MRALGRVPLLGARPEDVAAWFRVNLRDPDDPADPRPWSARTAHRRRAPLHGFYAWARRERLVAQNPVEAVELPRYQRSPPVLVGAEPIARLFAHVERRIAVADACGDARTAALYVLDAAVLCLMERLALRVSEASGIRLSHMQVVDTAAGPELQAYVAKKGNKPRGYPITGVVLDACARWLQVRQHVAARPGHDDFLFVHPWTGHRVSRQRAWHRLKRLAAEAGLPSGVVAALSPHKLRHARARRMLDDGWDLAAVQAVLDHANIATTSVYLEDDEHARLHALRAQGLPRTFPGASGIRCE